MRTPLLIAFVLIILSHRLIRFWMASPRVIPLRQISEVERSPSREQPRRSAWSVFDRPVVVAMAYFFAIVAAEVTTIANHWLGLPTHTAILFTLLLHGSSSRGVRRRALLWVLALAPLIRVLSLSLPLVAIPVVYWYALISVPVVAASIAATRALGYSRRDLGLGLRWRFVPLLLLIVPLGIGVGVLQYVLLEPRPLVRNLNLEEMWIPAVILVVSTGFVEELVFRGLLQRAAVRLLGAWGGILYATAVFTALHSSYLLLGSIGLVFVMGLLFAGLAWWTRSLVLPAVAHATINVTLFLVAPLALQRVTLDSLSVAAIREQVTVLYGAALVPDLTLVLGPLPLETNADEQSPLTPSPVVGRSIGTPAPAAILADVRPAPSTVQEPIATPTAGLTPAGSVDSRPVTLAQPTTATELAPTPTAAAPPSDTLIDARATVAAMAGPSPSSQSEPRTVSDGRILDGVLPVGIGDEAARLLVARIAREVGEIVADGFRGQTDGWRTLATFAARAWTDQYRGAPWTLDPDERRIYEENRDALFATVVEADSPFRNYRESYIGAFRKGVDVPRARELDAVLRGHDGYTSPFRE